MMEVSGQQKTKLTQSVSHGSAEDFVLFCIPCDRDGEREPAKGFCSTCNEHLCKTCYKHHKKPAPLRNHVLLNENSMPTTPTVPISQDDFNSCDDHQDEKQKYYCRDHDIVVCSVCVTLDHRTCTVGYIPKLSKHILNSEELNELMTEMKSLEEICKLSIKRAKDEIKAISENHDKVIKAIHQFRKEINTRLDDMEQLAVKGAQRIFDKKQTHLKSLSTDKEDMKDQTVKKKACLDDLIERNCLDKLYVEMKAAKKRLVEMKLKAKQHSRINNDETVSFAKHQAIIDVLQKYKQLGDIVFVKSSDSENVAMMKDTSITPENQTLNLEVVEDINVISALDKKNCDIHVTGIEVIQPDKIVVCDYENRKVKWYDTEQKKTVSEMKLNNSPYDVAAIAYDRFVVTVPSDRSVHFMSLKNHRIASDRKVNINETCRGIACSNDKLVVSCNSDPGKVLVLDIQGNIMQSFSGDNSLFCYPYYVTVNTAGTSIYVSDWGYYAVKQLDWQGNVINTYQPAEGRALRGICELNDGTFLVCLHQEDSDDNLRRISDSCKPCKITINEDVWGFYPSAVAYCKKTRKLYVSYSEISEFASYSCIKVFKVK